MRGPWSVSCEIDYSNSSSKSDSTVTRERFCEPVPHRCRTTWCRWTTPPRPGRRNRWGSCACCNRGSRRSAGRPCRRAWARPASGCVTSSRCRTTWCRWTRRRRRWSCSRRRTRRCCTRGSEGRGDGGARALHGAAGTRLGAGRPRAPRAGGAIDGAGLAVARARLAKVRALGAAMTVAGLDCAAARLRAGAARLGAARPAGEVGHGAVHGAVGAAARAVHVVGQAALAAALGLGARYGRCRGHGGQVPISIYTRKSVQSSRRGVSGENAGCGISLIPRAFCLSDNRRQLLNRWLTRLSCERCRVRIPLGM